MTTLALLVLAITAVLTWRLLRMEVWTPPPPRKPTLAESLAAFEAAYRALGQTIIEVMTPAVRRLEAQLRSAGELWRANDHREGR